MMEAATEGIYHKNIPSSRAVERLVSQLKCREKTGVLLLGSDKEVKFSSVQALQILGYALQQDPVAPCWKELKAALAEALHDSNGSVADSDIEAIKIQIQGRQLRCPLHRLDENAGGGWIILIQDEQKTARLDPNPQPITSLHNSRHNHLATCAQFVGASPAMHKLYGMIERVAPTEATVFLTGETGTGKEMVARILHEISERSDGPFMPLNCGALPNNLIESELFGHERGSFTSAERRHLGYFERAAGGTLFLDEITEIAPEMQTRLLRVLETGSMIRLGGERAIRTNVRVIAASNRCPKQAVADGKLREDLFYRLMVFPLHLAPLRERGEDVVLLARHFLQLLNKSNKRNKIFSATAIESLRGHAWPGNVRELKNIVHHAFILADEIIDIGNLLEKKASAESEASACLNIPVGVPLAEAEHRVIAATLKYYAGNKKKAAESLGLSLKTLYNRLNS